MIKHMKSHKQTDNLAPLFEGYIHYQAEKKKKDNSLARGMRKIQQVQFPAGLSWARRLEEGRGNHL